MHSLLDVFHDGLYHKDRAGSLFLVTMHCAVIVKRRSGVFNGAALNLMPQKNREKSLKQLPSFTPRCILIVQLLKYNKVALPDDPGFLVVPKVLTHCAAYSLLPQKRLPGRGAQKPCDPNCHWGQSRPPLLTITS